MSDDIREVLRPTPFSPLKRAGSPARRRSKGQGFRGPETEEEHREKELSEEELDELSREVSAANKRLADSGRNVRLRLSWDATAPLIEIILPDATGVEVVTRKIAPADIAEWERRLESGEGLIIDEQV